VYFTAYEAESDEKSYIRAMLTTTRSAPDVDVNTAINR